MADQPQNPPAEPMTEPEDMKEMIAYLKCEFRRKLVKFKVVCNNLRTFVGNEDRFEVIISLCTRLVVINRDQKLEKHLDELQNLIDKCSQYYSDLVNSDEWKKAMTYCEEMKNKKSISNWVGCRGLDIVVGCTILFWLIGMISATAASIGVVVEQW